MSTLREIVYNSVIAIHRRTGKEWIPLKEIYKEVDKNRDVGINNGGASVRAALETHSALSEVFSGTEEYILKEKGSGLYKSIYYDQIKFINNMNIGFITYTGEGLTGDQTITKNNKTIYESNENDLPMYLFSKDNNKKYIFEGQVKLCAEPYQLIEKDIDGNDRLVWKFPLSVVYPNDYDFEKDEKFNEIVYEITEIESKVYSDMVEEQNDIEYREGKINIRKYRKTGKKIQRTKKPDYIAEEIIKTNQGIINEKVVYENEIRRLMEEKAQEQIKKMEEFFNNKKENEGFDILSFELNDNGEYVEKYIEVKSTKGNEGTPIDITSDEIDFAKRHIDNYYLYRIINSESKDRYLKIVKGKDLFNNTNYNFIPTSYKIYSN